MEDNKIDKIIKEKFENRSLKTSPSAWERLENSLEESQKKTSKNRRYKFIAVAASILLLLSVFNLKETNNIEKTSIEDGILVETQKTKVSIKKGNNVIDEMEATPTEIENKMIASKQIKLKNLKKGMINKKNALKKINEVSNYEKKKEQVENIHTIPIKKEKPIQLKKKKRIKINSNDLLYAVTHSPKEVKEYYAKLKLNRDDVLDTIKKQLHLSNLKINPESILAEVERSIEDDEFKGNFMQTLKLKINDIAVAIADRNK